MGRSRDRVLGLLANLGLSLCVMLVLAGALEWLARRFERHEPLNEESRLVLLGPDKLTQLGSRDEPWPPRAHPFNGDGIRDRVHAVERPARTWRLVFLGDSVTFGHRLDPSEAYPQVLQRKLDSRGERVEVFNVALPAWATPQHRMAYERIVRKYKPDQVLLGVCLNDILEMQNTQRRPPAPWLLALYQRSALVRRVIGAPAREIRLVQQLCTEPDQPAVREGLERFFAEIRRLRSEVEADHARFGMVVFPFLFQVEPGAPPPRIQALVAGFAQREGIPLLDVLAAIRAAGPSAFVDHSHFSALGSEVVAEQVMSSRLLPALPMAPDVLARAGGDRSLPKLLAALRSNETDVRWASAWTLGRLPERGPRAVAALTDALNDEDEVVRDTAAQALGAKGPLPATALAALYARLSDPAKAVRWRAAEALWASGTPAGAQLPNLLTLLRDGDPYVASFAAQGLARSGAPALSLLLRVLQERELGEGALNQALVALKAMAASEPDVVTGLARTLDARAPWARARAAQALGRIGPEAAAARSALERRLSDEDPEVRRQVSRALNRLAGRPGAARP